MLSPKPLHHQVNIVRIPEPRVHTNADTLELFDIVGYQLVAKKGNYKPGDLAIFIQPDSVVPQTEPFKWLWEGSIGLDGTVPPRRRRITVRKFRKEFSEGLLMPLADFYGTSEPGSPFLSTLPEGYDVSDLLGITHYNPEDDSPEGNTNAPKVKVARRPKTIKGWLRFFWYRVLHVTHIKRHEGSQAMEVPFDSPHYDVAAMKATRDGFKPEQLVTITEKLHGSSARFVVLDGVQYIGSHFQWKSPESANIFVRVFKQHPWIGEWCQANQGRILYGEVIGDMGGFTYGLDKEKGELGFRAFDIREPNGTWSKPWTAMQYGEVIGGTENSTNLGYGVSYDEKLQVVPILYVGPFDRAKADALAGEKKSTLDNKTTREGVVVSLLNEPEPGVRYIRQLKLVSNTYLEETSK